MFPEESRQQENEAYFLIEILETSFNLLLWTFRNKCHHWRFNRIRYSCLKRIPYFICLALSDAQWMSCFRFFLLVCLWRWLFLEWSDPGVYFITLYQVTTSHMEKRCENVKWTQVCFKARLPTTTASLLRLLSPNFPAPTQNKRVEYSCALMNTPMSLRKLFRLAAPREEMCLLIRFVLKYWGDHVGNPSSEKQCMQMVHLLWWIWHRDLRPGWKMTTDGAGECSNLDCLPICRQQPCFASKTGYPGRLAHSFALAHRPGYNIPACLTRRHSVMWEAWVSSPVFAERWIMKMLPDWGIGGVW